jgi:hypothetical protein
MRLHLSVLLIGAILIMTVPLPAHHAQEVFFHQDRTVEVKGVVKSWYFANPHPVLRVESTDENGKSLQWSIQFAPATVLGKRGWSKDTFKPGEVVIAKGHPSKAPGTYGMEVQTITRADGSPVR